MDYEEYHRRCLELAELHESGNFAAAEAGWRELLGAPELAELDRAMLLHNLAYTMGAAGRGQEAEAAFDQAIAWERVHLRGNTRVGKANWLTTQGRPAEAAAIYDELAAEPWATWSERRTFRAQAAAVRAAASA